MRANTHASIHPKERHYISALMPARYLRNAFRQGVRWCKPSDSLAAAAFHMALHNSHSVSSSWKICDDAHCMYRLAQLKLDKEIGRTEEALQYRV
jgi:hypothetical protein